MKPLVSRLDCPLLTKTKPSFLEITPISLPVAVPFRLPSRHWPSAGRKAGALPAGHCLLPRFQAAISIDLVLGNDKLYSTSRQIKTGFIKSAKHSRATNASGFTLVELLVVLGVIAVLIIVQVPVLAGGKSQTKIGMCASNVRQIALACQIYANEYNDKLPVWLGGNTAWDFPDSAAQPMLKTGLTKKTFYCPGTAPRFTDAQNWAGPNPSGATTGYNSTLWDYGDATYPGYHVIGYLLALSGSSSLIASNQNTTIQPEVVNNFPVPGATTRYGVSDRVLVADATISSSAMLPGYMHPENNYVSIPGGFQWNGMVYPHVSPHLKGNVPAGGNLGFKDGHVDWRKFELMTPRSTMVYGFWW